MKKLISTLLALTLSFSLVACSTDENNDEDNNNDESITDEQNDNNDDSVIEINMPTYKAGENVGAVFFLPQVERFNKKYEGKYHINIEAVPQDGYADKIKQLAIQNKLPTIVHGPGSGGIDAQWFEQTIVANDMAYDLTEYGENNPEVASRWIEDSRDFSTIDGKLVAKPITVVKPVGFYYNSSMYDPDKEVKDMTYDEFVDSLGDQKIAFQTAENAWTTQLFLTALIATEDGGVELLNNAVRDKLWDYTDPAFVNAVKKLEYLLKNHASDNTLGAAYADAANTFMSKKAAIIANGSWMISEFDESESADKWSNGFDGADVRATIYPENVAIANTHMYGEYWIADSATDEEKEAALAFFSFMDSQEEIEKLLLAEGGQAPNLEYSEEYKSALEENPLLYQLSSAQDDDTTYIAGLGDVLPASIAENELAKFLPLLIDGSLTAEEFCQELTNKAQSAK